jgi:pimeloyl-ACP methyl ester carboxylesterase
MKPIVFIHGLWLASRSWENFERYFGEKGYPTAAPEWPRKEGGVEELRRDVAQVAGLGIGEIVDHYDAIIRAYDEPPIIIGHSFGGLVTMLLLDRGLGAAGVAMDPAPPKGIFNLPLSQLRASSPALLHPSTRHEVVALNFAQFTYGFVNTFTETGRPLWEAAFANFNPKAPTKIDFARERAPLLITAGGYDHTVPASVSRAIYRKQSASPSRTDLLELPDKPHLLTAGPGWEDTAAKIEEWLSRL